MHFTFMPRVEGPTPIHRWLVRKADWRLFTLNTKTESRMENFENVDEMVEQLTTLIHDAVAESIP